MSGTSRNVDYDTIIVGGGMAGATLACVLGKSGLRIGVIEAHPYQADTQPSYDARTVALGYGSWQMLKQMGIADQFQTDELTPISHIHVSERGGFGFTRIDHAREKVPALGYVVENRVLGNVLWERIAELPNVDTIVPAQVRRVTPLGNVAEVEYVADDGEKHIRGKLVVIADGGRSGARESAGFSVQRRDYDQTAIVANVTPEFRHNNIAWERFTGDGAVALLPISDNRYSLVWTMPGKKLNARMNLSEELFLKDLHETFGDRCGRFIKCGERGSYPLSIARSDRIARDRVALVGNACWSIHPVAGQGFNRGLRDIGALAELLWECARTGEDPGSVELLQHYRRQRWQDNQMTIQYSDKLVRLFTQSIPLLRFMRNLGLIGVDLVPGFKHGLATFSMGNHARLPRFSGLEVKA